MYQTSKPTIRTEAMMLMILMANSQRLSSIIIYQINSFNFRQNLTKVTAAS